MKAAPTPIHEFGDFRIDAARRRLWRRDGTPVPLTPKVFDTLLFMVEHNDSVLDKERLMEAVWPDSIVEENNLTQNVSTLRRVFGDSPESNNYIVTVPGRGYRFVAAVTLHDRIAEDSAASEANAGPGIQQVAQTGSLPDRESDAGHRSYGLVVAVALAVFVVAGLFFFFFRGRGPAQVAPASRNAGLAIAPVPEKSIAVLPFDNLSSDKENGYFAAGVQDEILSNLSKIADLKVISRTSANLYKSGSPRNAREIGQQLGVAYLLEGSVQRTGNRVRVNGQLVDARSDAHLWAQSYDRDVADLFAIQSELAQSIAAQLQARLAPEEKARLESKPTSNPEAYLIYLKARERARIASSKQDAVEADKLYGESIALDPSFALAHARDAILNSLMYQLGREAERKVRARALAEEALRLAPQLGEAHLALGLCWYQLDNNYAAALNELSIAGAITPNDPDIIHYTAVVQRRQGHWREAVAGFKRAQDLDPRYPHSDVPGTYVALRDWPAAAAAYKAMMKIEPDLADPWVGLAWLAVFEKADVSAARRILDNLPPQIKRPEIVMLAKWQFAMLARDFAAAEKLAPDFSAQEFPVREPKAYYQALALLAKGDTEAARTRLEGLRSMHLNKVREDPETPKFHAALGLFCGYLGEKEDAIRESQRAVELCPETSDAFEGPHYLANLAVVYALTGQTDKALPLIERLLSVPAANGITRAELRLGWQWDPLRGDPRFEKMVADLAPSANSGR